MEEGILKHNAKANDSFRVCLSPQSSPRERGRRRIQPRSPRILSRARIICARQMRLSLSQRKRMKVRDRPALDPRVRPAKFRFRKRRQRMRSGSAIHSNYQRVFSKTVLHTPLTSILSPQAGRGEEPESPCALRVKHLAGSSWLDLELDQTCGTLMDRESASPAVARNELLPVEGLFVAPKQIERRAGRFFPAQVIIHMPFP